MFVSSVHHFLLQASAAQVDLPTPSGHRQILLVLCAQGKSHVAEIRIAAMAKPGNVLVTSL